MMMMILIAVSRLIVRLSEPAEKTFRKSDIFSNFFQNAEN